MSMYKLLLPILLSLLVVCANSQAASKQIYRYKNNEGILVMDTKIPAEYAGKGYEIITPSGKVIKKVAPSLSKEEAARVAAEKLAREERLQADIELKRSYSGVSDIDAAKARNLESLQANIAILSANLETTKQDLAMETKRAASLERSGRKVGTDILTKIDSLQKKETDIAQQITQRELELKEVSDKFDQDKKRFIEITESAAASVSSQ